MKLYGIDVIVLNATAQLKRTGDSWALFNRAAFMRFLDPFEAQFVNGAIAASGLTFGQLSKANAARLPLFKNRRGEPAHSQPDGSDWNIAEWTNAIAGEVGEACNLAKKIQRGDFGAPGDLHYQVALHELAKELADVVTYADIACQRTGHNLGMVTAEKFNEVSVRVGCEVKL